VHFFEWSFLHAARIQQILTKMPIPIVWTFSPFGFFSEIGAFIIHSENHQPRDGGTYERGAFIIYNEYFLDKRRAGGAGSEPPAGTIVPGRRWRMAHLVKEML
jgi:hypothetical protein